MDVPDIPEKELLTRCLDGDKQAWDDFVLKYSRLVRHSLFHTLGDKNPRIQSDTVDDLHQDVFASLMENNSKKMRQFRGENGCSLASWIRLIAVRKARDYLRKNPPVISIEQNPDGVENFGRSGEEPNPESETSRQEYLEIMREALKRLHPRHQLFVELFYRRELDVDEISQIMNLTPNGVHQLHHRVKDRVREILQADYPEMAA